MAYSTLDASRMLFHLYPFLIIFSTLAIQQINDKKYNWNASNKSWDIFIDNELDTNNEIEWLKEQIYNGRFKGLVELVSPYDRYKENL